jgi:maltose alpha-D-glucosyltransferase/alpha-amylase
MSEDFLAAYWPAAEAAGILPADVAQRTALLDLFRIEKALYEIGYEAANRPTWLPIPVRGLLAILESGEAAA